MAEISEEKREEIEKNFNAISQRLNEYMPLHANKYALMRHGEVVEFYSRWEDAYKTGRKFYDDGLFSVQKVTNVPIDLGFFSHVLSEPCLQGI